MATALCAVTRGDTPLVSPFRVQRDRDQSTKSSETRQRHTKPNAVEDDARVAPVTIGAAHALRTAPEGAAPQDAGRLFMCLQTFLPSLLTAIPTESTFLTVCTTKRIDLEGVCVHASCFDSCRFARP